MRPEWRQDPTNKNVQPAQLPEFEISGAQTDSEHYDRAMKLIMSRATIAGLVIALIILVFNIPSLKMSRSGFAVLKSSGPSPFENRLRLQAHSVRREESVRGFIFNTKAQAGFTFVVADVTIHNQSDQKYQVNIYTIKLVTDDDQYYSTDLQTRTFKGGFSNRKIHPGERARGFLVFRVPRSSSFKSLEIRGSSGPLTATSI